MKYIGILLSLFLVSNLFGYEKEDFYKKIETTCSDKIENFTKEQYVTLIKSYLWGEAFGLGNTLAAIAWTESCMGLYKINLQDPSAGAYHNAVTSVMARHPEIKNNSYTQNVMAQMLIKNDKFAAIEALLELTFWESYYIANPKAYTSKNNSLWEAVVKSYNKGSKWHSSDMSNENANNYLNKVKSNLKKVETFLNKPEIQNDIKEIKDKLKIEALDVRISIR